MPKAPAQYRPAGRHASGRTAEQQAYRLWYLRLPWTDKKGGGIRGRQLREKPLCEECAKIKQRVVTLVDTGRYEMKADGLIERVWREEITYIPVITPATEVDHRIPHRGNWELFINEDNLRSLCKPCHSRKTQGGG